MLVANRRRCNGSLGARRRIASRRVILPAIIIYEPRNWPLFLLLEYRPTIELFARALTRSTERDIRIRGVSEHASISRISALSVRRGLLHILRSGNSAEFPVNISFEALVSRNRLNVRAFQRGRPPVVRGWENFHEVRYFVATRTVGQMDWLSEVG